jgi:excinuclease UvrABC helicase subunit UvrB
MKPNIFKSFRKLTYWYIFFIISILGLFIGDLLSFKEMITLEIFIIMSCVIGNLIIYADSLKKETDNLKMEKNTHIKMTIETNKINSFLIHMCEIANKHIDHPGWKKEWNNFINTMKKAENDAKKLFSNLNNQLKGSLSHEEQQRNIIEIMNNANIVYSIGQFDNQDDNEPTIEDLKTQLKKYERSLDYEKCAMIRDWIKDIEKEEK